MSHQPVDPLSHVTFAHIRLKLTTGPLHRERIIVDKVIGTESSIDGAAQSGLRAANRLHILETLYQNPGTCRPELAVETGLSRATVASLVEELQDAGLVTKDEEQDTSRPRATGRPPVLLSLVRDAAFAVGLDFGHDHIRVAVCDLSGVSVADEWSPAEVDYSPMQSLDLAQLLVNRALDRAGINRERLLGVGMGLAAPINGRTGELHAEGILPGWRGIRPAEEMESRLGVAVRLENDANVGALGERMSGAGRGVDDMIYVRLSAGIGAGLILNGQPYSGFGGTAGEIGHVVAKLDGLICRCGNRGCLETVASPIAVAGLVERSIGRPMSVSNLLDAVKEGDRGACRAIADAGEAVGQVLSVFVNVLNPELVVVGGELAAASNILLDPIQAAIRRHSVATASADVRVVTGKLGNRAEVLGAAALILSQSPRALALQVGLRYADVPEAAINA